jgi:hypothetical protein
MTNQFNNCHQINACHLKHGILIKQETNWQLKHFTSSDVFYSVSENTGSRLEASLIKKIVKTPNFCG